MANEKALEALARIGGTEDWRAAFIRQLLAFEAEIKAPGVDVREELTGPLVDAMYDDDQVVRKTLSNGVTFEFLYRSKIARDFVMSQPEHPDHAWEPMTSRILVNLAKGAKQVVIGGAYFGDHAVLIAREIAGSGGVVHARTTATIMARLMAPVRAVTVSPGDRVRKGQVLVVLDSNDLAAGARAARSAALATEQESAAAAAERDAAEARLALAHASHNRIAALQARRSATAQELDEAVAALRSAEAGVAGAFARASQAALAPAITSACAAYSHDQSERRRR